VDLPRILILAAAFGLLFAALLNLVLVLRRRDVPRGVEPAASIEDPAGPRYPVEPTVGETRSVRQPGPRQTQGPTEAQEAPPRLSPRESPKMREPDERVRVAPAIAEAPQTMAAGSEASPPDTEEEREIPPPPVVADGGPVASREAAPAPPPRDRPPRAPTHPSVLASHGSVADEEIRYEPVSSVELRFAGEARRVGVRPGTPTHDAFIAVADALRAELPESPD
jgi:hypothetical protein